MQSPLRIVGLLRPKIATAVVASVAAATFVFTATPFLLPIIAQEYHVSLSATALVSTTQLLGFSAGAFGAGRYFSPDRKVFVAWVIVLIAANLASSTVPPFILLLATRTLAGIALGILSWFGWSQVMGKESGTAELSMVGPMAGVVAAPIVAPIAAHGMTAVYLLLAAVSALPLVLAPQLPQFGNRADTKKIKNQPVRAAAIIIFALGAFTAGGSAVFIFSGVMSQDLGISMTALSFAFSLNSLAGVLGARWPWSRGPAGFGVAATGLAAIAVTFAPGSWVFLAAIVVWGFLFWIGMPAALNLLAARSRFPEERSGDAQAMMALGRVAGPTVGGLLYDYAGVGVLGVAAATTMILAGVAIWSQRQR